MHNWTEKELRKLFLDAFEQTVMPRLESIQKKLDHHDEKFSDHDEEFGWIREKLTTHDKHFTKIEKELWDIKDFIFPHISEIKISLKAIFQEINRLDKALSDKKYRLNFLEEVTREFNQEIKRLKARLQKTERTVALLRRNPLKRKTAK